MPLSRTDWYSLIAILGVTGIEDRTLEELGLDLHGDDGRVFSGLAGWIIDQAPAGVYGDIEELGDEVSERTYRWLGSLRATVDRSAAVAAYRKLLASLLHDLFARVEPGSLPPASIELMRILGPGRTSSASDLEEEATRFAQEVEHLVHAFAARRRS